MTIYSPAKSLYLWKNALCFLGITFTFISINNSLLNNWNWLHLLIVDCAFNNSTNLLIIDISLGLGPHKEKNLGQLSGAYSEQTVSNLIPLCHSTDMPEFMSCSEQDILNAAGIPIPPGLSNTRHDHLLSSRLSLGWSRNQHVLCPSPQVWLAVSIMGLSETRPEVTYTGSISLKTGCRSGVNCWLLGAEIGIGGKSWGMGYDGVKFGG